MYALSRAGQEFCISKRKKENKKEQNGEKKQMPFHEKRQKHDGTLTKTTTKGRKTIGKLHSSFCLRTSTPFPTDATTHTHRRGGDNFVWFSQRPIKQRPARAMAENAPTFQIPVVPQISDCRLLLVSRSCSWRTHTLKCFKWH